MTSTDVLSHPIYKRSLIQRMVRELEPTDTFSRLCSHLQRQMKVVDSIADDLRAFHAPSECDALAYAGTDDYFVEIMQKYGYTPIEFFADLNSRLSAKEAYYAFGMLLHLEHSPFSLCDCCDPDNV
ncbi:MAG: hypothetical protein JRE40_00260 [Deltaproteobacteria bacterium]|nr:hypothetical protein [Deltaproteobacteria bacterium]